ncbi:DnaJ-domain-containing protein [Hypoxylon sp. NC0597]|nr:DnaJ-domain-containing protein [Hypoxylon sp. NC0597]
MNFRNLPAFDPYEILGVSREATAREIKTRYQGLCFELHLDRPGSESHDKFVRVQAAYGFLSDDKLRSEYDEIHRSRNRHGSDSTPRNSEEDEFDTEFGRHTINDNDPADIGRKTGIWAIYRVTKMSYCMAKAKNMFISLFDEVEKVVDVSDENVWFPLERIFSDITKTTDEVAVMIDQVEGALVGEWRDESESRIIVAAIDRLWIRVYIMIPKLGDLQYVAKQLTDPQEDREVWKGRLMRYASVW